MPDKASKSDRSILTAILTIVGGLGALLAFYKGYGPPIFFLVLGIGIVAWWAHSDWGISVSVPYKIMHSQWVRFGALIPAILCFGVAFWLLRIGFTLFLPQYDSRTVDLVCDPEFARTKYLVAAPTSSDLDKEVFQMDVWKRWLVKGVEVKDTEQLLVLQSEPFDRDYQSFEVDLQAAADCHTIDGCCFLVSDSHTWSRPNYRQVSFTAGTKDVNARISVRNPTDEEYLFIFVRIVSKSGSKLPVRPTLFNLRLKVRS